MSWGVFVCPSRNQNQPTHLDKQALENYQNAVLTKPKDVSPWWLRYSLVLFQEQQVRACLRAGAAAMT